MKTIKLKNKYKRVVFVSDPHSPYYHPDLVAFLTEVKRVYTPDLVVFSGDEAEFHNMSFHDSDPDLDSAGRELQLTIEKLKPLYKLFPEAYIMESNHGSMVFRKGKAHGIPKAVFKSYNEFLQAPAGWKWVPDLIFDTPMGPVYSCHGKSGVPGRLATLNGMSCIQGHFHEKFQITYIATPTHVIWDAHAGCLIDNDAYTFAYNKINPKTPVIGLIVIVDGTPELLPMKLNSSGRWIGRL
jgi:hypothetical protein